MSDERPNPLDVPLSIRPAVAEKLGYYVYLYVDPRSGRPFYVGKGCGQRVLAHLSEVGESAKLRVLAELRAAGLEPRIDILAHQLRDEETAFRIEAAVIDLLGLGELTNQVRGWQSVQLGRMPLSELVAYYDAPPVEVRDPSLLIRINDLYRHGMPERELYEATRGIWKLGKNREQARYAMAVFTGVVREVYRIDGWHAAGTTLYESRDQTELRESTDRVEFIGVRAPEEVRARYVGKSVAAYFPRGGRAPVIYAACGPRLRASR